MDEVEGEKLFSFAKKVYISLRAAIDVDGPASLFHLPISNIALQQLNIRAEDLSIFEETNETDICSYI